MHILLFAGIGPRNDRACSGMGGGPRSWKARLRSAFPWNWSVWGAIPAKTNRANNSISGKENWSRHTKFLIFSKIAFVYLSSFEKNQEIHPDFCG